MFRVASRTNKFAFGVNLKSSQGTGMYFFSDPEDSGPGDHQVGDLAHLWAHHEVVELAQSLVLRRPSVRAEKRSARNELPLFVKGCAPAISSCRQCCSPISASSRPDTDKCRNCSAKSVTSLVMPCAMKATVNEPPNIEGIPPERRAANIAEYFANRALSQGQPESSLTERRK